MLDRDGVEVTRFTDFVEADELHAAVRCHAPVTEAVGLSRCGA